MLIACTRASACLCTSRQAESSRRNTRVTLNGQS